MILVVLEIMVREKWNWYKLVLETLIQNYFFSIKVVLCIKYKVVYSAIVGKNMVF